MAEWDVHNAFGDTLEHHGILGMHWGIRRYQNKDGSLTAAGKKRQEKLLKKALNKVEKTEAKISKKHADDKIENEKTKDTRNNPNRISAGDAAKRLGIKDARLVGMLNFRDKLALGALGLSSGKTKEEKWLNWYNDERNMYALEAKLYKGANDRYKGQKDIMDVLTAAAKPLKGIYDRYDTNGWKIRTEQIKHLMKDIDARGDTVLTKPSYRQNGDISWMGEELYVVPKGSK